MEDIQVKHPEAFKAIFKYATLSILLIGENGTIQLTNPQTDNLFGYEPGELTGQHIEVLIPDELKGKHSRLMRRYFEIPKRRPMGDGLELSAKKKNGDVFPVEISLGYYNALPKQMAIMFLSDITHRKRTELALYEDEKRLRDIIQSISDAFMGFTSDWRYLYLNDKALSILGKSRTEILGKTIWEVFPSQLGEHFEKEFQKHPQANMAPFTVKTYHDFTWWRVRVARYNGGMALICSDITEAKYALEAQQRSEAQFSVIFNSSPSAISITELESCVVADINRSHTLLFGFTKEELIGKTMVDVGIYKNFDTRNQIIHSIKINGPISNYEITAQTKNGNTIQLLMSADIIRLDDKEFLLVSSMDITNSKSAMEELQRSEERFGKAFRASPVALTISTIHDGRLIEVNTSFLELFGYQLEEVIGHTAGELGLYPNLSEREKTIEQLRKQGYVRNKELICITKNRKQIHVIFSMEMIELRGEICVITTALDITDKKQAEDKLKSYADLLEQKVTERTLELTHALEREKEVGDMKSRFVSIASHEFRTPLSTILSSTYLLEQITDDEDDRSKHYHRIRSAVKNLTFILTEFLSLDRLEQRKVNVENELFDIDTLASEAIDEIRIAYRLPTPIDYKHTGSRLLFQDKRIIRNLFLNLVSNAAKYSPPDKVIKLRTAVIDETLNIQVMDEGIGIPAEEQKLIFTKFFRAQNANHIQGTGLGLNIARRYVELLGGKIDFTSTLGAGTEFIITIPIHQLIPLKIKDDQP